MRDAPGQGANALHALRPHELGFDLFLVRNIGIDREHRFRTTLIVSNKRPTRFHDDLAFIPGAVPQFAVPFTLADRARIKFLKLFWISVDKFADIPADSFLARPAVYAFGPVVPK